MDYHEDKMKYRATIEFTVDAVYTRDEASEIIKSDLKNGAWLTRNQVVDKDHVDDLVIIDIEPTEEKHLFCPNCGSAKAEVVASDLTDVQPEHWYCHCKECDQHFEMDIQADHRKQRGRTKPR